MSLDPKVLLDKCFEIEGLLTLIIQRNDGTVPKQVFQLLEEKAEMLYMEVGELCTSVSAELNPVIAVDSDEAIYQSESYAEKEEAEIEEISIPIEDDVKVVCSDVMEDLGVLESDENQSGKSEQDNKSMNEESKVVFNLNATSALRDENHEQDVVESVEESIIEELPECNTPISFQIKLTLNDRYRFRRELFNFSDEEMDEALEALSEMSSIEEVEDYFYNDLCWESEDEIVQEFMSMITTNEIQ